MPEIVYWNPWRRLGRTGLLRRVPVPRRVDNFGDLLGPLIVDRLRRRLGLPADGPRRDGRRLLAVGSILHFARPGDVVWGSGVNGKIPVEGFPPLDVRAVRGPRTAQRLRAAGAEVPEVFGDPALLIPHLWSDDELGVRRRTGGTVFVPNLHDLGAFPSESLDPRGGALEKVAAIASAERVVASSLHGMVVADAFGVPLLPVASRAEPPFKYQDYFEGTGRELPELFPDWRAAVADGGLRVPPPAWRHEPLLAAFPADLWPAAPRRTGRAG
jgi:pyruvyltransferase